MEYKNTRILLVEDDKNLGFVVQDFLELSGYEVALCDDGALGLKTFEQESFDLCILDIMLPSKDGFSLAKDIRDLNTQVPIIFLTSKHLTADKVKGLSIGGDDYITKPFSFEELLARIESILRRVATAATREPDRAQFDLGRYVFDYENSILLCDGQKIRLSKKENELLNLLCKHKNRLVKRKTALRTIWGDDNYFVGRSMDVYITKLRKHLNRDEKISIKNLHGIGFKLETV